MADAPTETFTDFIGVGAAPNLNANNVQNVQNTNVFDPFGTTTESNQNNLLGGWNSNNSNAQSQKSDDIFGGLGKYINTVIFVFIIVFVLR